MLILDENIEQRLIDDLHKVGYEKFSIRQFRAGITDIEVIEIAKEKHGIIITEDKDFGELFFSHQVKGCSTVFLRYSKDEYPRVLENLIKVLDDILNSGEMVFVTVTPTKIRIRKL
jgi:predicted nuclease of predicted toxin-antitoxin system